MKRASEVLREAKRLIDEPGKWWDGGMNGPCSHKQHCIITALNRVSGVGNWIETPVWGYIIAATGATRSLLGVADFNDSHGHPEVMSAFDRAIALAEADEQPAKPRESDTAYYVRQMAEIQRVTVDA